LGLTGRRFGESFGDVRSHRAPAGVIALALAVGLGAVLIALSVAPEVMPGDTFRAEARSIASATAGDSSGAWARDVNTSHGWVTTYVVVLGVVLTALCLGPVRLLLGSRVATAERLAGRAVPRFACRAPPA
jgi:hypothetical protein